MIINIIISTNSYFDHGVCGRPTAYGAGCVSTMFSLLGITYYKICSQVRGYGYISTDAFEYDHIGRMKALLTLTMLMVYLSHVVKVLANISGLT